MDPNQTTTGDSAFGLLAEGVQRQLFKMGWPSLRPLQVKAIRTYLQTEKHLLLMAETAGGKTEAAFLPLLSAISTEPPGSVRAIYVGPLKALINDQFGRLEELCTYLDLPVHRWHGDVAVSRKAALVREPGGVLLITPESLESVLINRTSQLSRLFGGLRAVVIDEVHSFLENERGLHLASLLSRMTRYLNEGEPRARILGLSATVGDVAAATRYLSPDDPTAVEVITDSGEQKEIQFRVHGYTYEDSPPPASEEEENAEAEEAVEDPARLRLMRAITRDLVGHCAGHSNLVFANAKGDIEMYADLANERCRELGVPETFLVHHGSLSKEVREDTEQEMKAGSAPRTTICSSTLEMGIDIGSVHTVGQVGPPWSVASLKQRMGRSGRREGEPRRLRVYVEAEPAETGDDPLDELPLDLLQAVAVCELMLQKWVEPPRPAHLDFSTLTHQIISTIAETGSVDATTLYSRLCEVGPFRSVPVGSMAQLLRQLGTQDIIEQGPDGRLILGLAGEQIRHRKDFYAAFAGKTEFMILHDGSLIGTVPIETVPKHGEHLLFAARRWQVVEVDSIKLILHVRPAKRRRRPRFTGGKGDVHDRVRREMASCLLRDDLPRYLDAICSEALEKARAVAGSHGLAQRSFRSLGPGRTLWLTWTGSAGQRALMAVLAAMGVDGTDREVAIECRAPIDELRSRLSSADKLLANPLGLARHVSPKQVRKYDHLLTDEILEQAIAVDRLDCSAAAAVLRDTVGS